MTAVNPNRLAYYPALDGLRGVAILLVVLYHNFGFIEQSYFGWLGVDLFFVLSGFLITDILIRQVGSNNFLRNFFARRMLRIFPLYYLVLIIFLVVFPLFGWFANELGYFVDNQWWLWTYTQNWLYSFYLPENRPNQLLTHLWSLAVEEQFYLVWPFVILLVKKPGRLFFIMSLALVAVMAARCLIWIYHVEDLNYTTLYTFTRVDGICIGSLVALAHKIRPGFLSRNLGLVVLGLAILNFIFYFLNNYFGGFPYLAFMGYTTFACMFGLLVYEIVLGHDPVISRLFNIKPLRFVGRISYGFYIFHWPVYLLTRDSIQPLLESNLGITGKSAAFATSLTCTAIAFVISIISFYFYEQRFLRLKKYFANETQPAT